MTKTSWIERLRFRTPEHIEQTEPEAETTPTPVERSSPGLGALFGLMKEDGRHSILDFGQASDRHLRFLGRYARQIRFAGLVSEPPGRDLPSALSALAPNPTHPYDVVLAWNVLDRLDRGERAALIARLAEFTAPGARLYAAVDASDAPTVRPMQSTILDVDRVEHHVVGPPEPARPQLLPAHMEGLFSPFEITHAFMLRVGLREYVVMKPR